MKRFILILILFSILFTSCTQSTSINSKGRQSQGISQVETDRKTAELKALKEKQLKAQKEQAAMKAEAEKKAAAKKAAEKKKAAAIKKAKIQQINNLKNLMTFKKDKMETTTWIYPKGYLDNYSFWFYCYLGRDDGKTWFRFRTGFTRDDWIFIESLRIRAGNKLYNIDFDYFEDRKDEILDGDIMEGVDIVLNDQIEPAIKALIEAGKGTIRFLGQQYYIEKDIPSSAIESIRNVYNYYKLIK